MANPTLVLHTYLLAKYTRLPLRAPRVVSHGKQDALLGGKRCRRIEGEDLQALLVLRNAVETSRFVTM